jgi:hypothetical protein
MKRSFRVKSILATFAFSPFFSPVLSTMPIAFLFSLRERETERLLARERETERALLRFVHNGGSRASPARALSLSLSVSVSASVSVSVSSKANLETSHTHTHTHTQLAAQGDAHQSEAARSPLKLTKVST